MQHVDVMHIVPPGVPEVVQAQIERALATFVKTHADEPARPLLVEGTNVAASIIREAESAQLVVMGAAAVAPATAASDRALFGELPETVAQNARPTVIVVKTREPIGNHMFEQRAEQAETLEAADRAAEQGRSIAARVDRWFAESNYHHSEFSDLGRLVALKQKQGTTISAVFPTLNEEKTIGAIVQRARRELVERFSLVDELVVVDSESDDDTRRIAAEEGARVVVHSDVLPGYGSYQGQGRGSVEEPLRDVRRPGRLVGHGHRRLAPALPLWPAWPAPRRATNRLCQSLLPAPDRRGRPAQGGRWRSGD